MNKKKELLEKRAAAFGKINEIRQAAEGREMTAEERSAWGAATADWTRYNTELEQEEEYRTMTSRMTGAGEVEGSQDSEQEYRSAFAKYLSAGNGGLNAEERAAIEKRTSLASGMNGSVMVPTTLSQQIEVALKAYGGVMGVARVLTTANGGELVIPTLDTTSDKAGIVAEYGKVSQGSPTFGSVKLGAYKYCTPIVPVSYELLQDSEFDIDSILAQSMGDSFARGLNYHFTHGAGTGQPMGMVTAATEIATKAAAAGITFDDMLDLFKSVDPVYSANGKWMFNQNTLVELMKLKDNNGQYIFNMPSNGGAGATVWGKEYALNQDMHDIGAGKCSVLFGDLSKYMVRQVKGFTVLRANELLMEYLAVGIMGYGRFDGNLINAGTDPIKKLVHANA